MNLQALPEEALKEILALTEAKKKLDTREKAQDFFMPFAHHVYENFIEGKHHKIIAEKLERIAEGKLKRLIVNMPPRHSKSELASYLMPAWFTPVWSLPVDGLLRCSTKNLTLSTSY